MHIFCGSEETSEKGPQPGSRVFAGFFLVAPHKFICQQILLSCSASPSSLLMADALQQNLHHADHMKLSVKIPNTVEKALHGLGW